MQMDKMLIMNIKKKPHDYFFVYLSSYKNKKRVNVHIKLISISSKKEP